MYKERLLVQYLYVPPRKSTWTASDVLDERVSRVMKSHVQLTMGGTVNCVCIYICMHIHVYIYTYMYMRKYARKGKDQKKVKKKFFFVHFALSSFAYS